MIINIYLIVQHYDWEYIKAKENETGKRIPSSEVIKMFQYKDVAERCLENFNKGDDILNGAPWYYKLVKI